MTRRELLAAMIGGLAVTALNQPHPVLATSTSMELSQVDRWLTQWRNDFNQYGKTGDAELAARRWAKAGRHQHPVLGVIRGRSGEISLHAILWERWAPQLFVEQRRIIQGPRFSMEGIWRATERATGTRIELPIIINGEWNAHGELIDATEVFDQSSIAEQLRR